MVKFEVRNFSHFTLHTSHFTLQTSNFKLQTCHWPSGKGAGLPTQRGRFDSDMALCSMNDRLWVRTEILKPQVSKLKPVYALESIYWWSLTAEEAWQVQSSSRAANPMEGIRPDEVAVSKTAGVIALQGSSPWPSASLAQPIIVNHITHHG